MGDSKTARLPNLGSKTSRSTEAKAVTLTPKQARSRATRRELIDAAKQIFARDGFDHARLDDIARAAGKTRGAFYDHFQDKEDIFFAIFEEDIRRHKARLRRRIGPGASAERKREALIDHMMDVLNDREGRLLGLEFKLYAIRHPPRTKRLADLHAEMCFQGANQTEELYPEFLEGSKAERRELSLKIGSLIDGLSLNRMFDTGTMSRHASRTLVKAGVEEILGPVREAP